MEIKDFKQSNLFDKYNDWIETIIANDYYSPESYNDDGDLIQEASFDIKGLEKAEAEILDLSFRIYDKIAHGRIFTDNSVDLVNGRVPDHASILLELTNDSSYDQAALLGTVYYLFVYDYPNYKPIMSNKSLMMRIYIELFTRAFVNINHIKEWLDLYSALRGITSVLALPESLRKENVLIFLNRLRDHNLLDDSYKFTPLAKRGAWMRLIAYNLTLKSQCIYAELEEHFEVKNLRDNRPLDTFKNKKSKNEANDADVDIYNTINKCFHLS